MLYDPVQGKWTVTPLMEKLRQEKKAANDLQEKKHTDWDDNYQLARGKVKTNRLTQRQAVNIPLMKETVKTALSKIDDVPMIDWQELSGDEQKELIYQEIWNKRFRDDKMELLDMLDKKNVLMYGISTTKLNLDKDGVCFEVLDPYDVIFDPLMLSGRVETARFIVHQNIFRSVREILADDRYTKEGKDAVKIWEDSQPGISQSAENRKTLDEKMERLKAMGVTNADFPLYAGGDRVVNLTEHYTEMWDTKKEDWVRRVVVYAEDTIPLMDETLEDLIGCNEWPFVVWSEDPETNDLYSDSIADMVRTPNKVLNVWFSQLIENRTLKNFQMHWFLPGQNYTPQTYTPGPGMMLPAPPGDDINKVIKPVEVSGLDDTLQAIQAVTAIVERGTGTVAVDKGVSQQGVQTLGEVQILVGKSMERATSMAKFYRMAWYERAMKWNKMMHENAPKFIKLYKAGRSGKMYENRVYQGDWKSESGYEPMVRSTSEQETESIKSIQKFMFILQQFPENIPLKTIAQKRMLESLDLTPEELRQVEEGNAPVAPPQAQPTMQMAQTQRPMQAQQAQRVSQEQPENPDDVNAIQGLLSELTATA